MTELDRKVLDHFPGKVVRKDLTSLMKKGANVPTYVLEYLLGMYCATDDEDAIQMGIEKIKKILSENYVRPDQSEYVKSKIRENGQYTIIDKATIKLLHTTPGAYGVKKKVVHIVRLQLLKRILENLYGSLATPSLGSEVGKLRGYEVTASVITLQGIARSLFGKPFTISRRRVEIIYPML